MIGLEHYLTVAAVLFVIGIFGLFLNRKNVIILLMSIELMLLSVNINMVAFSAYNGDLEGQIFSLFILVLIVASSFSFLADSHPLVRCDTEEFCAEWETTLEDAKAWQDMFHLIEWVAIIVFTIEYVTRLTCTYDSRLSFVVAPLRKAGRALGSTD